MYLDAIDDMTMESEFQVLTSLLHDYAKSAEQLEYVQEDVTIEFNLGSKLKEGIIKIWELLVSALKKIARWIKNKVSNSKLGKLIETIRSKKNCKKIGEEMEELAKTIDNDKTVLESFIVEEDRSYTRGYDDEALMQIRMDPKYNTQEERLKRKKYEEKRQLREQINDHKSSRIKPSSRSTLLGINVGKAGAIVGATTGAIAGLKAGSDKLRGNTPNSSIIHKIAGSMSDSITKAFPSGMMKGVGISVALLICAGLFMAIGDYRGSELPDAEEIIKIGHRFSDKCEELTSTIHLFDKAYNDKNVKGYEKTKYTLMAYHSKPVSFARPKMDELMMLKKMVIWKNKYENNKEVFNGETSFRRLNRIQERLLADTIVLYCTMPPEDYAQMIDELTIQSDRLVKEIKKSGFTKEDSNNAIKKLVKDMQFFSEKAMEYVTTVSFIYKTGCDMVENMDMSLRKSEELLRKYNYIR